MDTVGQLKIFLVCVGVGVFGGVVYEVFSLLRLLFGCRCGKRKGLAVAIDVLYCMTFAFVCIVAAYAFRFPAFRVYMWGGYLLGGILYLKILHKTIAFFENMCYNKISERIKKAKERRKTLKTEENERL